MNMRTNKRAILTLTLSLLALLCFAQGNPVKFKASKKQVSDTEVQVMFTMSISKGWHVYSTGLPADGPVSATLHTDKAEGVKPIGGLQHIGREISEMDPIFGIKLRYFENNVTFVQKYKITGKTYNVKGYLEFGACNDEMCMPPTSVEFNYSGEGPKDAPAPTEDKAAEEEAKTDVAAAGDSAKATAGDSTATAIKADTGTAGVGSDLWTPVIKELKAFEDGQSTKNKSVWYIFLMGIVGGFVALLTPCVWPIIPMTVSFFLKRSKDSKSKGIRDAATYGISIIVIYMALALIVTALLGPQRLNELATNAPFNIFFFLLLVVFAFSFFGWFELQLPSSWGNAVDTKASTTTGLLSIALMAFTLCLVSFSCTAPIIGLLLVEAATSGDWVAPTVGMFGFALALALPFSLFAMFPTWLQKAPKSGSWMNMIKVVLGFVELAFSLKFLSVADLAYGWGILDRETFLALWIMIFAFMGFYLIGWLKFPHDEEVHPAYTSYEEGMAAAKAAGKPVMLDFTGFGCVNCRKMESAVWTDNEVSERLTKDYVLISLFVDDKTPLDKPMEVKNPDGTTRTLRTVGDKWSYLEQTKFGYLAQPFHVTVDNEGKPLSGSFVYKEDIPGYIKFLDKGLENYKK